VIADVSHGHSQWGSEHCLRRRRQIAQCFGQGAVCVEDAEDNEAPAHAGTIRNCVEGGYARANLDAGNPGFPDQAPYLADAQHATSARNLYSGRTASDVEVGRRSSNDKSIRVAQAVTSDGAPPQQSPEQEHQGVEALSCELTIARRDIEFLQHLEQEHDRAEPLEQDLAAVRRDVETQAALTAKAVEETARMKQAAQSGATELQKSLQTGARAVCTSGAGSRNDLGIRGLRHSGDRSGFDCCHEGLDGGLHLCGRRNRFDGHDYGARFVAARSVRRTGA
jgi:hypothetical protein